MLPLGVKALSRCGIPRLLLVILLRLRVRLAVLRRRGETLWLLLVILLLRIARLLRRIIVWLRRLVRLLRRIIARRPGRLHLGLVLSGLFLESAQESQERPDD